MMLGASVGFSIRLAKCFLAVRLFGKRRLSSPNSRMESSSFPVSNAPRAVAVRICSISAAVGFTQG